MSMWILLPCHFRKLMVGFKLDSQSINTGLSFSLDCLHSSLRGLSGSSYVQRFFVKDTLNQFFMYSIQSCRFKSWLAVHLYGPFLRKT